MKPPIEFFFDFSSPYSTIASEWIEALAARHGRTVRWHAVLLGATLSAEAAWNDPQRKMRGKRANDEAITAGVFGAPYVLLDGEPFWGNDRKPQIERWPAQGPF